jgi:uncharacterized protein YwbE
LGDANRKNEVHVDKVVDGNVRGATEDGYIEVRVCLRNERETGKETKEVVQRII